MGCDVGAESPQLVAVDGREAGQLLLAERGEDDQVAAAVGRVGVPADDAGGLGAVNQLGHRVVPQAKRDRQFTNARIGLALVAFNGKEQLVLRRGQARLTGGVFGERQELAERTTKPGERPVLGFRDLTHMPTVPAGSCESGVVSSGPRTSVPQIASNHTKTAIVVYTDGACSGNPGPGGWAWAVPGGEYASGAEARTTNQRMEIQAVIEALRALTAEHVEVVSDSTYVVNCFRDRWWENWLARGWTNSQRKPVANRDLWEPLLDLYEARGRASGIDFQWVKGHSGDPMNDFVDRLAVEAAAAQAGQAGAGDPDQATMGSVGPGHTPDLPDGHPVAVAGLRPPGLGGYGGGPIADAMRARLVEILAAKRSLRPDLLVLTGLGLGTEQLAAEAAVEAKVPYVAVLPYPDSDSAWPPASRDVFRSLLTGAAQVKVLQAKPPVSRQAAGGALARRDAWLARHSAEAIVVWDGKDAAVGKLLRSLQDHLGEDEVWILTPEP